MDIPNLLPPPTPRSEEDQQVVRDHVAVNRAALRAATAAVIRAAGPRLIGDVGVGMDPDLPLPTRWWGRVQLQASRGGTREVLVEGFPSALEALEGLHRRIQGLLRLH